MTDTIHQLLEFWFGDLGTADLPSSDRTQLWFGEDETLRIEVVNRFSDIYDQAIKNKISSWCNSPRGSLCLIILYDQFTRCFNKDSKDAFSFDEKAQNLCIDGIEKEQDQAITLIERVFFYMPLVHSENIDHQKKSIRLFQGLATLSMPETSQVYQLFLAYAYAHFRVIKKFNRFPQRNLLLGRESTKEEISFLKNT